MTNHWNFPLRATSTAVLALTAAAAALPLNAWSAPFGSGNFVAYRVGGEAATQSVYLDEFRADGTLVQSIPLSSTTDKTRSLAASITGSEGLLTRSASGQCLAVPGYAAVPSESAKTKGTKSKDVPRVVALVGAQGEAPSAYLPLGNAAFNTDSIRSAISDDCSNIWVSGAGDTAGQGVWYLNGTSAPAPVRLNDANTQGLAIANGGLFVSMASKGTLNQLGHGVLPTTQALAAATPVPDVQVANYRGISFVQLDKGSTGVDTLYVAANSVDAIQKYSWDGSRWVLNGSVTLPGAHGLIALATGDGNALLMATDSSQKLYRLLDTSGARGALAGKPVEVKTTSSNPGGFLGLAWTPEATPPQAAPLPPSKVTATLNGNTATVQWTPADTGTAAAFYVVESSTDDFATVDQSTLSTGSSADLNGLQSGAQKFRVRAVNSVGASPDARSGSGSVAQPPAASLPENSAFSGVMNDQKDPLATQGVRFTVSDSEGAAADVIVTATSSNPSVVPADGVQVTNQAGNITAKIIPAGVGLADITLTFTSGKSGASSARVIHYAASANTASTPDTRWFTGRSDASTALFFPGNPVMFVADDEAPAADSSGNALPGGNAIFGYDVSTSGSPSRTFVPDTGLGLGNAADCSNPAFTGIDAKCSTDGEVDLEASFLVGQRGFFLGSHSNSKKGRSRPDRWRVFAVDANPADASLKVAGYYRWLREDLRDWDHLNQHQLGSDYFGIVASSNGADDENQAPESSTLSGFSIEGATTSPDDQQMWLGFRAPLVSAPGQGAVTPSNAAGRTHALIIPVGRYNEMLREDGGSKHSAAIGQAIRLDLGGRGIREIRKNGPNDYLIVAGPPNGATGEAPRDFRLFFWDGRTNQAGLARNVWPLDANLNAFTSPNSQCSAEGIATVADHIAQNGGSVRIISDCGDATFYDAKTVAKDLPYAEWKKFRMDTVQVAALPALTLSALSADAGTLAFRATLPQKATLHAVVLPKNAAAPSWEQIAAGNDATDQPARFTLTPAPITANQPADLQFTGLDASTDYVLYAVSVNAAGGASLIAQQAFSTTAAGGGMGTQTISFADLPARTLGSAPLVLSATGGASGNPVTFDAQTPGICKTSGTNGSTVTLLTVGHCTIRASQAGNANYSAAEPVDKSFAITLPALTGSQLGGANGATASVSGNGWQFGSNSTGAISGSGLPALPAGYEFVLPQGFSFVLAGGSAGSNATVQLQWPQAAPGGAELMKFGPTGDNPTAHWFKVAGSFSADRKGARLTLTDGKDGDADLLANGVIVDPVFLVKQAAVTPPTGHVAAVPTLSDMGRVLLALGLAGLAALGLRRRKPF